MSGRVRISAISHYQNSELQRHWRTEFWFMSWLQAIPSGQWVLHTTYVIFNHTQDKQIHAYIKTKPDKKTITYLQFPASISSSRFHLLQSTVDINTYSSKYIYPTAMLQSWSESMLQHESTMRTEFRPRLYIYFRPSRCFAQWRNRLLTNRIPNHHRLEHK